jgi:hypothetical protein
MPLLPPALESPVSDGVVMFQLPRPLHLSHRERSKSSFMISGEGFSPSSYPHPESTALSSPRRRGSSNKKNWIPAFAGMTDASASAFLHLSHRERSKSSFMISGEGFSPSSCPHPESTALSSPRRRGSSNKKNWIPAFAGMTDASASAFLHLSHRERSKSSFMISGEGFSPSNPHPNFGKRNSTSPGGRGKSENEIRPLPVGEVKRLAFLSLNSPLCWSFSACWWGAS